MPPVPYDPVDLSLASDVADEHMLRRDAAAAGAAAAAAATGRQGGTAALASWLSARSVVELSPAEARAAFHLAGLVRMEIDPSDPRLERAAVQVAPAIRLDQGAIAEIVHSATGKWYAASSLRRMTQEMRDAGLLRFAGGGEYVVDPPRVVWPTETDRKAGWIITKRSGAFFVL